MLNSEKYQNILVDKATDYLQDKLKTKVEIDRVRLEFFNTFAIKGVFVQDDNKDTLAYIGSLNVNTSDLFRSYWNGDKSVLKSLRLEDAYINLYRKTQNDRWNYDFIVDAFAGDTLNSKKADTSSTKSSKEGTASNPEFDIKELDLKRVRFNMNDAWRGEDFRASVNELNLNINEFDIKKLRFEIDRILIDGVNFTVKEYVGGKPKEVKIKDTSDWGTPFNPNNAFVEIKDIQLKDSWFHFRDGEKPSPKNEFDERNLVVSNINASIKNTKIIADTIFSEIQNLNANERCGLKINMLQANVKFSQVESVLTGLKLNTNHSHLENSFAMYYQGFHSFEDFLNRVEMRSTLKNSHVSSKDIAYFANILSLYPIDVKIEGEFRGIVKDLKGNKVKLSSSKTSFDGDVHVKGLPDIENTFFDATVRKLVSTGDDLNKLIPQTRVDAVDWSKLKHIEYSGTYDGKVDQFHTKGDLVTSLGNANLDLNLNIKSKVPSYSGSISVEQFDVGALIKQSSIGKVTMNGKIDGRGFDLNTLNSKLLASVDRIELNNEVYTDISINGLISNKKFDGIFVSQDPSLAINFNGVLDLSGSQPNYNFNTRFIRFNLQKLGITDEPVIGSGYASLNFKGDNIDNFIGSLNVSNLTIENKGKVGYIESLTLQSFQDSYTKRLVLESSVVEASIEGNFEISQLANTVQTYLHHYLPQYIKLPKSYKNQDFTFKARINNADSLVGTLVPELKSIGDLYIAGSLNSYKQQLAMDVTAPKITYNNITFNNLSALASGNFENLEFNLVGHDILVNNEAVIPSYQVAAVMADDTASLSLNTQSINDILGEANLKCNAKAINGNLFVKVNPSTINVKNDIWSFSTTSDMVFGNRIVIDKFIAQSGAQQIQLKTLNNNEEDMIVDINNIDLESISQYVNSVNPTFYGRVSGNVLISDFVKNPTLRASLNTIDPMRVNQDTVGMVSLNIEYNIAKKNLTILKPSGIQRNTDYADIAGEVNMEDSTIDLRAKLNNTNIGFLNQFIDDFVKDLKGNLDGDINIVGRITEPSISGNATLKSASMKVLYLGVNYFIDKTNFTFNNKRIDIEKTNIYDERGKNYYGVIMGRITHDNFSKFNLSFDVNSDNLVCLNTSERDNDLFYGYVPSEVSMKLRGPLDDLDLKINCKTLKGTKFYMPIGGGGDAGKYDYVRFAEIGRYQSDTLTKNKSASYVKIDMNIQATEDAEVSIILDKNTGEEIVARGEGNLKIPIDLGNNLEMYGAYLITSGVYKFNFRGVFNKDFIITPNSKITWSGDPLAATMNVEALYKCRSKLALKPLVSDLIASGTLSEEDKNEASKLYDTYVGIKMTEALSLPKIDFDITQPENRAVSSAAYQKLESIRNNPNELTSQAAILLLFEQFRSPEGISNTAYTQTLTSTVSDVVFGALSSEITNQFQKLTKLQNVNINLNYKNNTSADLQTSDQVSLAISTNLFKDRVIVDFENGLDINRNTGNNSGNAVNLIGNYRAQYIVTEDGRIRLNAFLVNSPDLVNKNNTRGGLGISYKRVFNNFNELFTNQKRRKKTSQKPEKDITRS